MQVAKKRSSNQTPKLCKRILGIGTKMFLVMTADIFWENSQKWLNTICKVKCYVFLFMKIMQFWQADLFYSIYFLSLFGWGDFLA